MAELGHEKLAQMVANASDLTETARLASERARDYYDGHQWTTSEIKALQARKQPVITINRIQRKVDAMLGIEQRGRTDPRAMPRTPADEQAADVATKALVFVEDTTRFDQKRTNAFENMIIEGYGGAEIIVEQRNGRPEIVVSRLRWEEIFFDPHSREKDFSDASFMGVQKWMNLDAALEQFGELWVSRQPEGTNPEDAMQALEEMLLAAMPAGVGVTYEDRPRDETQFQWVDKRQRRVRLAQMYYRRMGVWYFAIVTGGGTIVNEPSAYLDEDGKPSCPMVLMTAYIDRENRRYGLVRTLMDIQDEINKRRSKVLHQLNSRQTWSVKGAVDVAAVKREKASPDGHIEVSPEYLDMMGGRLPFGDMAITDQVAGQFSLLQESKSEIDMLGPNASLLGQLTGAQSGRAIMAQQQAGFAELAPIYDSLRDWTLRCYRQMWMRIRQFWTDERYIRVTDEMQAPQFIAVNRVIGMQEAMDPQSGQVIMQPVMENELARLDVDLIIEDAPDMVSLRQEQFEQLTQMAQAGIPIPPEMVVEASSLRDKRNVLQVMKEAQAQAAQAAQAQMQMEAGKAQADVQAKQAKAQRDAAEAAKTNAETPGADAQSQGAVIQAFVERRALLGF